MIQVAGRDMRSVIERHMPKLPEELETQLDYHCNILYELFGRLSTPRANAAREIEFLRWAFAWFIATRNARIDDIRSDGVLHANRIKESLLPHKGFYFWLCVDSRVGAKAYGFHRRAIRFPAGETNEFYFDNRGELSIHPTSRIARIIIDEFVKTGFTVIAEAIESHIDCAKRADIEEQIHLVRPDDMGLRDDVLKKQAKMRALSNLLFRLYGDTRRLFVTHTSLDPENGHSFTGLDRCLQDELVIQDGLTREVLKDLVREGKAISTYELVEGTRIPAIKASFKRHYFNVDFEKNYVESTVNLWEAIRSMSDELLPIFEYALKLVYPPTNHPEYQNDLRQRAVLLLANAFTAYLLNSLEGGYPYAKHKEETIVVTYNGDRGPFETMIPFSNDPSSPDLSDDVFFTDFLIRKNRLAGRMSSKTSRVIHELGFSLEEFARAPVPLVTFQRVKDVFNDIKYIQMANWSGLLDQPWMAKDDKDQNGGFNFSSYVRNKFPGISFETANTLIDMRDFMRDLYRPGTKAVRRLWNQDIVPLPIIADDDRRALAIASFNRIGCDDTYFDH